MTRTSRWALLARGRLPQPPSTRGRAGTVCRNLPLFRGVIQYFLSNNARHYGSGPARDADIVLPPPCDGNQSKFELNIQECLARTGPRSWQCAYGSTDFFDLEILHVAAKHNKEVAKIPKSPVEKNWDIPRYASPGPSEMTSTAVP